MTNKNKFIIPVLLSLIVGCSANVSEQPTNCKVHENTRHSAFDCDNTVILECDDGWYLEANKGDERVNFKCDGDIINDCVKATEDLENYCGYNTPPIYEDPGVCKIHVDTDARWCRCASVVLVECERDWYIDAERLVRYKCDGGLTQDCTEAEEKMDAYCGCG